MPAKIRDCTADESPWSSGSTRCCIMGDDRRGDPVRQADRWPTVTRLMWSTRPVSSDADSDLEIDVVRLEIRHRNEAASEPFLF